MTLIAFLPTGSLECRSSARIGRDEAITPRAPSANQLDDGIGGTLVLARCSADFISHGQFSEEPLLQVKCRINRIEQGRVAEWLEQAFHGTSFE
jgi:hypothetical protein